MFEFLRNLFGRKAEETIVTPQDKKKDVLSGPGMSSAWKHEADKRKKKECTGKCECKDTPAAPEMDMLDLFVLASTLNSKNEELPSHSSPSYAPEDKSETPAHTPETHSHTESHSHSSPSYDSHSSSSSHDSGSSSYDSGSSSSDSGGSCGGDGGGCGGD